MIDGDLFYRHTVLLPQKSIFFTQLTLATAPSNLVYDNILLKITYTTCSQAPQFQDMKKDIDDELFTILKR